MLKRMLGKLSSCSTQYGRKATILAGGTDLVPKINYYELKPDVLVYIGGLGLDYIQEKGGKLLIGAATPMAKIAASKLVAKKAGALAEAARQAGTAAIRTAATIGGNLANASPAADLATATSGHGRGAAPDERQGEARRGPERFLQGAG